MAWSPDRRDVFALTLGVGGCLKLLMSENACTNRRSEVVLVRDVSHRGSTELVATPVAGAACPLGIESERDEDDIGWLARRWYRWNEIVVVGLELGEVPRRRRRLCQPPIRVAPRPDDHMSGRNAMLSL